ncbi:hypothetical protein ABK040_004904 [Willaertia magna]
MQVTTIKDSRFYQPLFTYSEVNKLSVASFGLFDLTFIDNFNKVLFNNEIKDLNNLNQIVTVTFGYKQLVFIYENNNKTLTGTIITHKRDEEKELKYEQFDLPKEFRKKEDIQFFYYCSDFNKQVYFLQLKSTKQVFVKGNNNQFVLGIFNENNEYYKDWHIISDKRIQNIKDIKTNVFNTLFFMEDNKTYICGSYTNGKLIELKINETILTSEEELQIIKADLRVDGIIILTKSGEIYSTATSLNSFFKYNSKRLQLFGTENNFLTQLVIDFKVADIFSIDKELLLVRKEDLKLFILVKNEIIDIQLYLNEIKNIFFSFTEFYLETKKNELIYIEGKEKIIYNCNECTEYSKLKFPKIRGILNFYRYILVFFEEEDLIKRNFNCALNKCDTYKDISIDIA